MGLFVCDECEHVENTATSRFWLRDREGPALCSACDPDIAKWHGVFPREVYDPERHEVRNR